MRQPENKIREYVDTFCMGKFIVAIREPGEDCVHIGAGKSRANACKAAIRRLERLIGDVKKLAAKEG